MTTEPTDGLGADLLAHQGFLRRVARDLVGEDGADDLVQDAWVAALERPGGRPRSWRGWLRAVLRNKGADRAARERARRARERTVAREERLASTAEVEERLEVVRRVADALRELPEPFRRTLYLRVYEDRGPSAIARELGVPLETVHSRLRRGKRLLRERLDREYGARDAWALPLLALGRVDAPPPVAAAPTATALGSGALVMGSKTLLVAAAGVAATVTLFAIEPWSTSGDAADAPAGTEGVAGVAEIDVTDALAHDAGDEPVVALEGGGRVGRAALGASAPPALGALVVRARFERGDAPAAGVRGHLERDDVYLSPFVLDEDGAAELAQLAAGRWTLHLHGHGGWNADVVAGEVTPLELALAPGISVRGRVLDAGERPVAGAEVFQAREDDRPGRWTLAVTDAAGRFELVDVAPWRQSGPYTTLAARAPGHLTSHAWEAMGVPLDEVELTLRLLGAAGRVRGRVTTAGGDPVVGARLLFSEHASLSSGSVSPEGFELDDAPALVLVSDAQGEFASERVAIGESHVRVVTDAHPERTAAVTVEPGREAELAIVLADGALLEGLVTDADGAPVEHASVSAHPSAGRGGRYGYRHASTDADGRYRLRGLPGGELDVRARAAGSGEATAVATLAPGGTGRLDLVLAEAASVDGVLVDHLGAPLGEHHVCVIEPSQPGLWIRSARTDAAGRFRIEGAPGGAKAFEVRLPDPFVAPPILTAPWPADTSVPVRLVVPADGLPTASLVGIVADVDGATVEGAEIWLSARERTWGKQGFPDRERQRFAFGPLVPGDYDLSVSAPGRVGIEREVVGLGVGEVRDLGVLALDVGGVLAVELSSSDPAVETVEPYAELVTGADGTSRSLDASPNALVSPVLPAGAYRLRLSGFSTAFREVPVTIRAGETTRLEIQLDPGTCRVFRLEPPPAEGERPEVEVYDAAGARFHGHLFTFGEQVSVYGLSPGRWRVVVRTPDGRVGEATLEVDSLAFPTEFLPLALR